jgi:hypothetical protein
MIVPYTIEGADEAADAIELISREGNSNDILLKRSRDRKFESISLQQRVSNEPGLGRRPARRYVRPDLGESWRHLHGGAATTGTPR